MTANQAARMLQNARMAAMRKLRRSVLTADGRRLWAGHVDQSRVSAPTLQMALRRITVGQSFEIERPLSLDLQGQCRGLVRRLFALSGCGQGRSSREFPHV
jgi:hypothetical protein